MTQYQDGDYLVTEVNGVEVGRVLNIEPAHTATVVSWKHLEFRRRFTAAEQEDLDELEATFEGLSVLTAAQKKSLRTGYKNFNMATEIVSDDPDIPPMLGLFVALGKLDPSRPDEILDTTK